MSSKLPRIAISMGDPGGIGPEIIVRAAAREDVRAACSLVVVGSAEVLGVTAERIGVGLRGRAVHRAGDWDDTQELLIYDIRPPAEELYPVGRVSAVSGRAAYNWILAATKLVQEGRVAGMCTAPISKEAIYATGVEFPGHTELLAHLCDDADVRMMLVGGGLHVVLQTIHVALRDVPGMLSTESITQTLRITDQWWKRFYGASPQIAVCGLNPHASEGGHFGSEEAEVITPAIVAARADGITAQGPYPADTIFHRALQKEFDVVVAMYHDQALIPVKTLNFHGGVNLTLGLPIIRTSPDHGTAFEIAGKNVANESSMVAAILKAAELAAR